MVAAALITEFRLLPESRDPAPGRFIIAARAPLEASYWRIIVVAMVIARPHGVFAMDARIKVTPFLPHDPFFRRLR
jgi:hypothetical protein